MNSLPSPPTTANWWWIQLGGAALQRCGLSAQSNSRVPNRDGIDRSSSVSNVDVSTIRKFAEALHWRWVLPILMVLLTAYLIVAGAFEWLASPFRPCLECEAPAHVILRFLNGPAAQLQKRVPWVYLNVFGVECAGFQILPGVFIFWAIVGWALDRGLEGRRLIEASVPRWTLFTIGFGMSLVFFFQSDSPRIAWAIFSSNDFNFQMLSQMGLWSPGLSDLVWPLWSSIGITFFGRKLWTMLPWHHDKKAELHITI